MRLLPSNINLHYVVTILIISIGSIPKGYDEGGFAGVAGLPSFLSDYGMQPQQWKGTQDELVSLQANITSFGVLGAALGALASLVVTDRLGRLRSWQVFVVLWATGFVVTMLASGVTPLLLASRLWSGFGAGGLSVVAPLFLSEIAPSRSRGSVVSLYMVVLLSSLTLGFFVGYAAKKSLPDSSSAQYRVVLAVPLVPVGIALVASFFCLGDTPCWLVSKGRLDEALEELKRLRSIPSLSSLSPPPPTPTPTPSSSSSSSAAAAAATSSSAHANALVRQEFADMVNQVRGRQQELADADVCTVVRELALVPSYRSRFLLGLAMQTVAQWSGGNGITYYMPHIFVLAGVRDINLSLVTSGAYGAVKLVFTVVFTWALVDVLGRRRCFIAGLSMQCLAHVYMAVYAALWMGSSPARPASDLAIASVFLYAVGWSVGLCTIQYLYGTEILPTRVRGVSYAANMTLHWFFQFALVRVAPPMFDSLRVWGAFAFWAGVCAVGLVVLGLWAPETKGVPMESMGELFAGPWYMGWKASLPPPSGDLESLNPSQSHATDRTHVESAVDDRGSAETLQRKLYD